MIRSANWWIRWSNLAIVGVVALCLNGCGGGTTGSGGGVVQLSGSLTSTQGAPLVGVSVQASTVQPIYSMASVSGSRDVTDLNGAFTVSVKVMDAELVQLAFSGSGISSSYVVPSLPQGTSIVKVELDYNHETSNVEDKTIEYEDENGNPVHDSSAGSGGKDGEVVNEN